MKAESLFIAATLAAGAMLALPDAARAATYEAYHCHCTAAKDESCSCSYGYTLGKSATKEFRGYCDYDNRWIGVSGRDKNTTCTVPFRRSGYDSKSCTNWSLFSTDHISVKVTCTNGSYEVEIAPR